MKRLILALLFASPCWAQYYTTLFPLTENPISENSSWTVPGSTASQWGNVATNGTMAYPVSQPTTYGDATAILSATWGVTQWASETVKVNTVESDCCHEVSLRFRMNITSNNVSGYELLCPVESNPGYGYQIVRWNGGNGQFVYIGSASAAHQCVNGDVLSGSVSGTNPVNIVFYNNGTQVATACDNGQASGGSCGGVTYSGPGGAAGPWTSGHPGFGFCCNGIDTNFGISQFTAANRIAATCNYSDVNTAVTAAVEGDAVLVPAGSCAWSSSPITDANKALSIIGAGQGSTVITDSQCEMFRFTPTTVGSLTRLSGMTIQRGTSTCAVFKALGNCNASGCTNLRIDHITFSGWAGSCCSGDTNSYGLTAVGDMFGVFDHNTINGNTGNYLHLVEFSHASYQGVGSYGDNSWAQPEAYGSANFLFFEDNTFNTAGVSDNEGSAGSLANEGGGRIVVRHNQFLNVDNLNFSVGWHGTESNGRPRGGRAYEFYQNTFTCGSGGCGDMVATRSGTGLVWNNTINRSGVSWNNLVSMSTYRTQASLGGWGVCDGSSVYDTNDGTTYFSGTVGSVAGNTITVSGSPGWTTNQWAPNGAPYSVHDVTQNTGSEISANGSNTLTIRLDGGPGNWSPSAGDSIQILRATVCIDQAGGRGAGFLYTGTDGSSHATPAQSANEAMSPVYVWSNVINGGAPSFGVQGVNPDTARIIRSRDFYNENINQASQSNSTTPFDGTNTIGIGHGTLANRPTTCTTEVGYFATDQGGQGVLYQCTATNTWTLAYTPYTYPHPLTNGGSSPGIGTVVTGVGSVTGTGNVIIQ